MNYKPAYNVYWPAECCQLQIESAWIEYIGTVEMAKDINISIRPLLRGRIEDATLLLAPPPLLGSHLRPCLLHNDKSPMKISSIFVAFLAM